jgi:hypothetical protein
VVGNPGGLQVLGRAAGPFYERWKKAARLKSIAGMRVRLLQQPIPWSS